METAGSREADAPVWARAVREGYKSLSRGLSTQITVNPHGRQATNRSSGVTHLRQWLSDDYGDEMTMKSKRCVILWHQNDTIWRESDGCSVLEWQWWQPRGNAACATRPGTSGILNENKSRRILQLTISTACRHRLTIRRITFLSSGWVYDWLRGKSYAIHVGTGSTSEMAHGLYQKSFSAIGLYVFAPLLWHPQ